MRKGTTFVALNLYQFSKKNGKTLLFKRYWPPYNYFFVNLLFGGF